MNDTLLGLGFELIQRLRSNMFDSTQFANVYNYFYINKKST